MTTAMAAAAAAAAPWSPLAPVQPRLFKKRSLRQLLPESYDAPNDDEAGAFEPPAAAAFDFAPVRRQSLLLQLNNNNHHKPQLHLASAPASLAQGPHYDSGVGSPAAYTDSDEESEGEDEEEGEGEDQGDEQEDRRLPFKKRRCHSTLHDSEGEDEEAAPQQPGKKMADRYQQRCVQSQTPGASGARQQQQE